MKGLPGLVMAIAPLAGRLGAQTGETPPAVGAPDVDAELAVVDGLLTKQDWKQARDRIVALLEQAGPSDVLAPHVRQLDDALGAACFGLGYVPPDRKELPAGHVWEWKEDKRWVRLEYSRQTPELLDKPSKPSDAVARLLSTTHGLPTFLDFKPADHHVAGGMLVHDAHFGKELTLTIEGELPDACDLMPHVFVCIGESGYYHVQPTWSRYQKNGYSEPTQGAISLIAKGASKVLDTDRMVIGKYNLLPGHRYQVKVMVTAERIAFTINGSGHVSVARNNDLSGQVAFTGFPGIVSTEVKGDIDPAWFDDLAVQTRSQARQKFDADWPKQPRGPKWWPDFVTRNAPEETGSTAGKGASKSAPH